MRVRRRATPLLAPVAALLSLTGCGSLFSSKIPPASVYLLSAHAAAPGGGSVAEVAADLAVLRPQVRAGLDSERIAALYPDRRLDYYAGGRWSAPLDEVIQDLAIESFHAQGRLRSVGREASVFASGYWLEIQVADFQAEYSAERAAPTIRVHLLARIGRARDRQVLGRFDAGVSQAAADNRLSAIVAAYEQAADAALDEIVAGALQTIAESVAAAPG